MAEKNSKVQNLRVLAILAVVLGHCIIIYDSGWRDAYGYTSSFESPFWYAVKQIINSFQMELFFGISGFCFYYTANKQCRNSINIVEDKVKRLVVPYLSVALIWLVPLRVILGYPAYANMEMGTIIKNIFLVKDVGHLWFLPVLFLVFCVALPLRNIRNKYVLLLILLVSLFLASFSERVVCYIPRLVLKYFFFFYWGYLLNMIMRFKLRVFHYSLIIGGLSFLLLIISFLNLSDGFVGIMKSLLVCMMIILVIPNKRWKVIDYIDKRSFGIYLFHSPALIVGYKWFNYPPFYMCRCK